VAAVGFTITVIARHADFSCWLHPHLHRARCVLAGPPAGYFHLRELNSTLTKQHQQQ
jgi:ferredoxin-NADP reductase